ncbi:MAG: aminotransferase class V-fold PLP-dependent enzyme [Pirellulales bacterium]
MHKVSFCNLSVGEPARCASIDDIRSRFPALERRYAGVPIAYFDGPGGTQVPRCVVDAMVDYLYSHNANSHWNYPTSAETDEIIDGARAALADFVGGSPDEIVFGANATTLAFHVSRALAPLFSAGDEIVVTELDHHANVRPWQVLARERGCVLRVARMNVDGGTLDWDNFEQQISKRTKLVAIGAASNALGTVSDVARACRLAKSMGAYSFVDAVHYAPHFLADVALWGCDFLVCSAYKFYGPHIGALWCRREILESLPFVKVAPAPDSGPCRAETGTQNHEGIAGAAAAIDFLASLAGEDRVHSPAILAGIGAAADEVRPKMGRLCNVSRRQKLGAALAALHERSSALVRQIWSGLSEIEGVTLFGPPPDAPRTATVAFTVRGVPSSKVAGRLAERGVFVSHGDFYAATVIERYGLDVEGMVRAGCACYTTAEEVEQLVVGVRELPSA